VVAAADTEGSSVSMWVYMCDCMLDRLCCAPMRCQACHIWSVLTNVWMFSGIRGLLSCRFGLSNL